ncbi:MAG: hypothetical protein SGARI_001750 [Bacillariaceae sp.]
MPESMASELSSRAKAVLVTPEKKRRRDVEAESDCEGSDERGVKEKVKRQKLPSQSRAGTNSDDNCSGNLEPVLSFTQSKYLQRVRRDREDGNSTAPWCMLKMTTA